MISDQIFSKLDFYWKQQQQTRYINMKKKMEKNNKLKNNFFNTKYVKIFLRRKKTAKKNE